MAAILRCFLVVVLILLIGCGSGRAETGSKTTYGQFQVVSLYGSYYEMGRQYGTLLKDEMQALYEESIEQIYVLEKMYDRDKMLEGACALYDLYPLALQEMLKGMAETSGLGVEKTLLLNAIEWMPMLLYGLQSNDCSAMASWGDYSLDGKMVIGRNNDVGDLSNIAFAKYLVVTVLHPTDGTVPVAFINYAGLIYNVTGMNKYGLFSEMNSGPWQDFKSDRLSMPANLLVYLGTYPTLQQFDKAMLSTLPNLTTVINVADIGSAYSYESSLDRIVRRAPQNNGLLVGTNSFVDGSWDLEQDDEGMTMTRRENLLALGEEYKGMIDEEKMMQIFDTNIDDGGPTMDPYTIYQIVSVPATRTLWIKVPNVQDWTKIELASYFD